MNQENRLLLKQAGLTLLVSLIVVVATVGLNNMFTIQPQIAHLNEQIAISQLGIEITPPDWTALETRACGVIHGNTSLRIDITNNSPRSVQVLRTILTIRWASGDVNFTEDIKQTLNPGDQLTVFHRFYEISAQRIGQPFQLIVSVVTVELPLQSKSLSCVVFQ